ncbi:MarR family winged helix-turn-helix transcriptional regulator, partial [Streptomyces cuspidosporus]|uniref:MarR family winged helix-turn-helix transcriptional regulator n=1 Tax=Streptomyces cuspidosporus TaxID=66882 RepID=UPI0031FDC67A
METDAPDVAELAGVLEQVASWLRRTLRNEEWNTVALSVLDELVREGPRRVTELAALERASQPGMTGIVGRLQAAGLVGRAPDPTDGRATLVAPTNAPGKRPLALFLHGRHWTCYSGPEMTDILLGWPCPAGSAGAPAGGWCPPSRAPRP